jgi:type IV pilus assembly protein PilQ
MKATFPPLRLAVRHLLFLVAVALLALPARAQTTVSSNTLNAISLARGNNDSQVIKMTFKNPVKEPPIAFTTSNPHRLVLDFPATSSNLPRTSESPETGAIKNWQVARAGERTRVVLNLTGPASYELRHDRNLVLAVLRVAADQPGTPTPARFDATGPVSAHAIRDIDFRRGKDGESRVMVNLSNPGVGVDIKQQGRAIQVDFLNTSLPSPLQRRLDVADFATPAQMVETFTQGKNTRMLITPKGKWDYSAYQAGNQFTLEVRSLEGPETAREGKPQYSGEKLSLNFQNVEVRAVLQVIADFTGLNIITSDTVSGNVTLRLKDVPWDQALDIILRAKGLDKRTNGNVIWIAPRDELAAKEKLELEAKKSLAELDALITHSYRLNYVKANEVMNLLSGGSRLASNVAEDATCSPSASSIRAVDAGTQATTQGGQANNANRILSNRGGASFDLTTNTLIVTDTADRHTAVANVIKDIDVAAKQVLIEARIVVADDKFGRSLGARLGFSGSGKVGNTGLGAGTYGTSAVNATTGLPATAPTANVDLGGLTLSGSNSPSSLGISIFNASTAAILSLELQAMELDKRGKIVSNPRVVTTNLRPAVILQGSQIPYASASANTGTNVQFKDALLCLLVAPQVLNNDAIILNVEVQKDAQGETVPGAGPAINVKRVKTQVRVNNGETAVLGGIFEQTLRNDTEKVPLLGDLPLLGHLFRNDVKQDEKSELLIFLTPRVLVEDQPIAR